MKPKIKNLRDTPSRSVKSSIPRSEGSLFLMLNRLATEHERLMMDEADLQSRLEQKHKRMAQIEAEVNYYKERIELLHTPSVAPQPKPAAPPAKKQASVSFTAEVEEEPQTQWQPVTIEY